MSRGPLQVLVVNFEDANFTGEIQAEFERLEQDGILRVLDLLFVARSEAGEVTVIKNGGVHALGRAVLGLDAEPPREEEAADVWYAADHVEPGCAAGVVVLEHRWAIGLRGAIMRAGGRRTAAEWIDEEQLAALGVTLP